MFTRVKGTQDFLDLRLFNFIVDQAKNHLMTYHFTEIATPILEHTQLFVRSLGMQTDVVSKQMFLIETKDDETICLRPEATAATVRAFVNNGIQQTPWNVFSWGPIFRYERPQKGRYRQFHQINIESIGAETVIHDVQLITMLDRFFHEKLMLNNYALLVNFLGCFDDRTAYKLVLKDFLDGQTSLCKTCMYRKDTNIMRVFDCKNTQCQILYQQTPYITDHLCSSCSNEWRHIQYNLELLSVSYSHQPTLVRGLDYYNKTVFEFNSSNLGAQNAFCGGGRYDQLVGQIGAKQDYPSLGAAIGIERLILLLEPFQSTLPMPQLPSLYVIMPLDDEQHMIGLLLADQLRAQGLCIEVILDGGSIKNMMKKANKMGAAYALIIGADEQQAKEVTVKNMITGDQKRISCVNVAEFLKG
ncbi:histidine--tRNA ligase [Candidatus Dependentiae bacterium]|nr:histidine--tRNA ligase [Candidatus Dependentiae bacterium]